MLKACVSQLLGIRMRAVATGSTSNCQHHLVCLPSIPRNSFQRTKLSLYHKHRSSSDTKEAFTVRTPFSTLASQQQSTAAVLANQAAAGQGWTTAVGTRNESSRAAGSAAPAPTETQKRRRRRPIAAVRAVACMEQQQQQQQQQQQETQQPLLMSPERQQQLLDAVKDRPPVIFYHYPCADGEITGPPQSVEGAGAGGGGGAKQTFSLGPSSNTPALTVRFMDNRHIQA